MLTQELNETQLKIYDTDTMAKATLKHIDDYIKTLANVSSACRKLTSAG